MYHLFFLSTADKLKAYSIKAVTSVLKIHIIRKIPIHVIA